MRRVRLIIAYEGTAYVGWQEQPNGPSIQAETERALTAVTGETIRIHGSGRTDSGVHARAQVAHFDTEARMDASKFAVALNTHLPPDIRVLYSEECDPRFHARFSAKEKQYRYTVQLGAHTDVFIRNTSLHIHTRPNLDWMNQAADSCLGTHDFRAFMCADTSIFDTVRTLFRSEWSRDGQLVYYDVTGNGFLYNMVRILVGTMLEIGSGKLPPESVTRALQSLNRADAGATAPARGLLLYRVKYADFDTEEVLSRDT